MHKLIYLHKILFRHVTRNQIINIEESHNKYQYLLKDLLVFYGTYLFSTRNIESK